MRWVSTENLKNSIKSCLIFDVQVKDNLKVVESNKSIQKLSNKSKQQSIQRYILRTCFHESGEMITMIYWMTNTV